MTDRELLEDRLVAIEREMAIMKAIQGRLALPPTLLALLWGILIVSGSAIGFVVRLDAKVEEMAKQSALVQHQFFNHTEQPWHAAAGEKYRSIDAQVQRIEERVRDLENPSRARK